MTKTVRATPVATGHGPRISDQLSGLIGSEYTHTPSRDQEFRTATGITRKRCRNLRCRSKLPTPVENPHRAFCTRGCYESFYRNRCRVCERDLRKTGKPGDEGRRYCRPPNRCASEARKWPGKYGFGARPSSILRASKSASKATD